jgi:hypothetical protein
MDTRQAQLNPNAGQHKGCMHVVQAACGATGSNAPGLKLTTMAREEHHHLSAQQHHECAVKHQPVQGV